MNSQEPLRNSDKPLDFNHEGRLNVDGMSDIRLFSLAQVRELLGLGRHSLEQLIATNKLRVVTIGHRKMVSYKALREYVAELEDKASQRGNYGN